MPGRQAHGRPLTAKPVARAPKPYKKSKAKLQAQALDAYAIAAEQYPTVEKRTPRFRQLEASDIVGRKHQRDEGEDEDDDGEDGENDEEEGPRRKRPKPVRRAPVDGDDDAEYGSDSEGNEWRLNGHIDEDEDSEIESDEAFGESDEEIFEGYSFRGSSSKNQVESNPEDESDADSFGDDAIDLAQALDQSSDESMGEDDESGSEDDADSSSASSDENEDDDLAKLGALQSLVAKYAGDSTSKDEAPKQREKIDLKDLSLVGVKDPQIRKSLKIMSKEEKEAAPGASKRKLDVPLARRQQDKLLRTAAYEKTAETLDRWTETVKHNRRAEHLVFPLPQNLPGAGLDNSELRPLTEQNASNELEQAVMSIMELSGLLSKPKKPTMEQAADGDDTGPATISNHDLKTLWSERRREREVSSRETQRAKRIKKIKSKTYHRVHRRARQRDEIRLREAMEAAGEIDSEAEREAADRRRALERVGARHRDSRWAKTGSKTKRAVWDDDFRSGLHEMAQKNEELRKRKEGRTGGSDEDSGEEDEESDGSGGSNDEKERLLRQLDRASRADDGRPESKLMQMKFMRKAEEALKKSNDEMVEELRKELASGDGEGSMNEEEEEEADVGRRTYGMAKSRPKGAPFGVVSSSRSGKSIVPDDEEAAASTPNGGAKLAGLSIGASATEPSADPTAGAWSKGEARRKKSKKSSSGPSVDVLDVNAEIMVAKRPSKPKPKLDAAAAAAVAVAAGSGDDGNDEDADLDLHLPLAIRDRELVARAFAGEDVVGEFEREKREAEEGDDDRVVDETLPGWGSWIGEGISERERAKNKGRWLKTVPGVKKKDRKDAKLEKVIISEKTVKKNSKYLASQLPHPFESRTQYERSLRLPVGQEWQTRETFQDATKPRVILKQGIITPIAKPVL